MTDLTFRDHNRIRRVEYGGELWFAVVDIVQVLTDSSNPSTYWSALKKRSAKESGQSFTFCKRFDLPRANGKNYPTECANTEGILRIVMSIPSPKAEPLRLWLAQVGKERIEETNDPEIGFERLKELYRAKGYPEEWIERRLQTIEVRKQLTEEWQNRGVKKGEEFSILTATIAKGTFGLTPSEHAKLKGLGKENLRDHMTPLELIFTALGEEITRSEAIKSDAQGFEENHDVAVKGGALAGKARKLIEDERGEQIVSPKNFLDTTNALDTPTE